MPITVTAPRGALTPSGEREILPELTTALIEASGAAGNSFFTSIVGGTVHLLDPRDIYAGGANRPVVMVELKLPVRVEGLTDDAKLRMPYIAVEMDADGMHYAPAWQDAVLSEHAVGFLMPKDVFDRYAAADTKMHLELVAEELRPAREVKSTVADRFQGPMHGVCLLIDRKVFCRYPYEEAIPTRMEMSPCGSDTVSVKTHFRKPQLDAWEAARTDVTTGR